MSPVEVHGGCARQVSLRRGSLHLDVSVYDTYFPDLESVVLVLRDGVLLVMPVRHAAAGGLLLKVRNARGDRVVQIQEFLRMHGYDDQLDAVCPAAWDARYAALAVSLPATPAGRPS